MNFTVEQAAYHRNGSGGAGFYVGVVRCDPNESGVEQRMLVTFFPHMNEGAPCPAGKDKKGEYANGRVAVVSLDAIEALPGNAVGFGYNSWRGDSFYEAADAIVAEVQAQYA